MEGRIRCFLLSLVITAGGLSTATGNTAELEEGQSVKTVIEPQIERTEFDESKIDTTDFEVSAKLGVIGIEDFGSSAVITLKLDYHISEAFFIGAEWSRGDGGETSFETLTGGAPLLSDDEREMNIYLLTVGWNILPGETFFTDNLTYNSAFYLIGGLGTTAFGGSDNFTASVGAGFRVTITDFVAIYTEFRDHIFNSDIFGTSKVVNNLQLSVGAGFYF